MRKALILGLALVFVLGMTTMVGAHTNGPWYVDTSPYFNLELDYNAEIMQLGNNDTAAIDQDGDHHAFIGQGIEITLPGEPVGASENSEAFVDQMGDNNMAVVGQRGMNNFSNIEQWREDNYAGVGQDGDDMIANIHQKATDSFVRVSQFGGAGSEADITQYGDLNRIRTRQQGNDHFVDVYQGWGTYFNYATVEQKGDGHDAYVTQGGGERLANRNGVLIDQDGEDNYASATQFGTLNAAVIEQDAIGLSAVTFQDGDNNDANINQSN